VAVSEIAVVVPTLGASPVLERCLAALRDGAGAEVEVVVVAPRAVVAALRPRLGPHADRWVEAGAEAGFAGAIERGIAASDAAWVATVNDDAVVEGGWLGALRAALAADPGAGAAQGVNLVLDGSGRVDGWGLAWNRWWQAVQLGRGGLPPGPGEAPREVFGVSATAALYRRAALAAAALPGGALFDARLVSWYEDVDLACRLRAAGWRSLAVPAARALHAGSTTGAARPLRRLALVYGNRHLVAARLLGRRYAPALPRLLVRDLADVARGVPATGVGLGWARALRHLPAYRRWGPPRPALAELRRLAAEAAAGAG
jgi:GT2 family glycosyltransferase